VANGGRKEQSLSLQGPGGPVGATEGCWGIEQEQIDEGVRQDRLAHEAERAEEAAERAEAPKERPSWKVWA
jgi:hypothetical protein